MNDDPTQQGGTETQPTPGLSPRNAAIAQIAQQAHAQLSDEFAGFDEETGEIHAPQKAEDQPEPEAKPEPQAPPEVPPQKRVRSIKVDGQASEVDEDKIIEAGIRALQKDYAADRRLQEATRLKQQAEELLSKARTGQTTAPSQDAPQAAQAIEGITPETLTTLAQGLEPVIAQRVMTTLTAQQAVAEFRKEFSDIASDPDLWMIAVAKNQARLDHAAAVGEPAGDDLTAYRKIGEEIRGKFGAPKAPEPAAPTDKVERKRTITAIPAVNASAPKPEGPKVLTVAQQIEKMRYDRAKGYMTHQISKGARNG